MPAPLSANDIISRLGLQPLPHEGGFFARTWTSPETLPDGRPTGTAIYFLITPGGFSALHRLDADELWHFHAGDPIEHVQIPTTPGQPFRIHMLGTDLTKSQTPQLIVPAQTWQGARLCADAPHGWALVSCTMSPGWSDSGFELGSRPHLIENFSAHAAAISELTRTT